jgi:putative aldouronate transport system substrate-binding protein
MTSRAIVALLALGLVLGLSAYAEGGKEEVKASGSQPFPIKIYLWHDGVEFPQPGNDIQKILEKETNTKLDIKAYTGTAYAEAFPTIMASGDLPDVLSVGVPDVLKAPVINAARGGMLWDIGSSIASYPNLAKVNPIIYNNIKIEGKIYGLPKIRALVRRTFIYRKDWFDKLGLKEPKNLDEFYTVARTLTNANLSGTGKKDVYGLVMEKSVIPHFTFVAGAPNVWEVRDGKFVRDAVTPEYLNGLKFIKRLYDEGIIHPDFAILDRNKHIYGMYNEGKAAIIRDSSQQIPVSATSVKKNFPNAETWAFSLLAGPDGKVRTIAESGHNGVMLLTKTRYKKDDEMKKMLSFFDGLGGKTISNLFTFGLEGVHYKIEGGVAVPVAEKLADFDNTIRFPYRYTLAPVWPDDNAMPGRLSPVATLAAQLDTDTLKFAAPNQSLGLLSPTLVEKANLEQIITDAGIKLIMGQIDDNGFRAEIKRWRDSGGDKIAAEFAEAYAKGAR